MKRKKTNELEARWGTPKSDAFNFDLIRAYFEYKTAHQEHFIINDRQAVDLDLDEVFQFIDRTSSFVGQQYLYSQIRNLKSGTERIDRSEKGIQFFRKHKEARLEIQQVLWQLRDSNDYYFPFLVFGDLPEKVSWFRWIRPLQLLIIFAVIGSLFYPAIFVIPALVLFMISLFIHYWFKKRIRNFGYVFSRLSRLYDTAKSLYEQPAVKEEEKIGVQASLHKTKKILGKINFLRTDHLQDNEVMTALWHVLEIVKIITLSEISTFHKVVDDIHSSRSEIDRLFCFIGRVDLLIAIADLRESLPYYSIPQFTDARKQLHFEALYHPLVDHCVANDLALEHKSLLLTGSNMSGKTTFIRVININLILSQTLYTSLTRSYKAPVFDLATSIRLTDDVLEGKSFYMEEVGSIGELISRSEEKDIQYLFTIDEVFKGTNTIERISSAKGILEYLNKHHHIVLVSTHDIELTHLLEDGFDLHYFQEEIKERNLSFDYKLKKGALKERNAIRILEIAGYPTEVIHEAERLAKQFGQEKTGLS